MQYDTSLHLERLIVRFMIIFQYMSIYGGTLNTPPPIYKMATLSKWLKVENDINNNGLRGIVFTRSVCLSICLSVCLSVCVSVCPANILVFYFSAIRRDIDLKFIQDTYRVILNSLTFIVQWSRSQGRYIAF